MDLSQIYFLSEVGGKANQEDFIWPEAGKASLHNKVFIVCDGVGGADNGEIASRIISETVGNAISKLENREMSGAIVNTLLTEARNALVKYAQQNGLDTNMATTFTLLVISERKVFISWCGDSRIYHFRNGEILYRTSDHSLVNSLVKSGEITEEEALIHPKKNIILKAIKADDSPIEADHYLINDVQDGDYFMLCTDGLLENIADKDLKFLLTQNDKGNIDIIKAFQQFCQGKTRDNYSMYLLQVKLNLKSTAYKKKILFLTAFLILLISASAIILNNYFSKKQKNILKPANTDFNDTAKQQSVEIAPSKTETPKNINDTVIAQPAKTVPRHISLKDSLFTKKEKNPDVKKIPKIIMIDNSEDSIKN